MFFLQKLASFQKVRETLSPTAYILKVMSIDNLQPLCYAVISLAFVAGTLTFFLRFYSRQIVMHAFGWDDIFSVFLLVLSVGQQTALYMFFRHGAGKSVLEYVSD